MKQSALERFECHHPILISLITFAVALIALTITTSGSVFAGPDAKLSAPQTTTQEPKPADIRELKPGPPIERELAGGEAHSYRVMLTVGQYAHVFVQQKGVDVVVRLFGPDGKKLAEVDNDPAVGTESFSIVGEATGDYRLEVGTANKDVAAGRYEIRVEALREATSRDRVHVAAQKAFEEANQLRDQRTAESRRKAIKRYEEVLLLWRDVGDKRGEAYTLNELGFVSSNLGEPKKALEYYDQAVQLWRDVGDRLNEGTALINTGDAYMRLGETREALKHSLQALALTRLAGDRKLEAFALSNIGSAYNGLSEPQKALEYFSQALAISRSLGDHRSEAYSLVNSGMSFRQLGELQKSLESFRQAVPISETLGDPVIEASTLHNLANAYLDLGELQKALDLHKQNLPLRRKGGDRRGESYTLEGIGVTYERLGQTQKALDLHNQALTLRRTVGDRRGETFSLLNLGTIYDRLGEPQKALDFYRQALSLAQTRGDRQGEAKLLYKIGGVYSRLGEVQEAKENLHRALDLSRAIHDRVTEAFVLYGIAQAERSHGSLIVSRAHVETALNIIESIRVQVASQELRSSYLSSFQNYYEFYIDLLMQMHRAQPSAGHDVAAFEASERARARSLLEILTEARTDIRQGVDAAMLGRERSSQQQLNAKAERLTRLLSGKHTEEQEAAARKEVDALLTDYQDVQAQIRAKSPRYAALTQPQPLSSKEIQLVLDEDTLLLEYALGEERSYLWAVTPTSVKSFELPGRAEIEATARRFYELLTTRKNRELDVQAEAAAALSRLLLRPVADQLGRKRLLIVTDGALHFIPFAALPEPVVNDQRSVLSRKTISEYQPLLIRHEIVTLPSASVLAVMRRELAGRLPSSKTVAVLADPVFRSDDPRIKSDVSKIEKTPNESLARSGGSGDFKSEVERSAWESGVENLPRLKHSREEAKAIVAQTPARHVLLALDFAANREAVISGQLQQYRIVHFATHSLLNNVHPELSGIVLSLVDEAGSPQNGFVRLHEVYNLKLPAELVVLSGCRTAGGKHVKGEGLIGLTRGFMYAGAARVVVSLWTVSDEGTAELMKRFYQGMLGKGLRPAAALRAAQIAMWKSKWWEAPYYWAGFVIEGEWR